MPVAPPGIRQQAVQIGTLQAMLRRCPDPNRGGIRSQSRAGVGHYGLWRVRLGSRREPAFGRNRSRRRAGVHGRSMHPHHQAFRRWKGAACANIAQGFQSTALAPLRDGREPSDRTLAAAAPPDGPLTIKHRKNRRRPARDRSAHSVDAWRGPPVHR